MMNCSYDAFNKSESYSPRKPTPADPSSFTPPYTLAKPQDQGGDLLMLRGGMHTHPRDVAERAGSDGNL